MKPEQIAAPWTLSGEAYVMIYKFSKAFVEKNAFLPEFLKGTFNGGMGTVLFFDFKETPVGPFRMLAFMPSRFLWNQLDRTTVSKCYVDSQEAAFNLRENWGINAEMADFEQGLFEEEEVIRLRKEDAEFFEIRLRPGKINFPVNTKYVSFAGLVQQKGKAFLTTNFHAKSQARLASLKYCRSSKGFFPDVSKHTALTIMRMDNFSLTFETASPVIVKK